MPSFHRTAWRLALLAPIVLALASCGGSPQNRPQLIGTFPDNLDVLPSTLAALRLEYDEPVTVLNPESVLVVADGIQIPTIAFQVDGDPNAVYVRPTAASTFRPDALHAVVVFEGLVINAEEHYPLEEESFTFEVGPEAPIAAGATDAVKLFDRETFALLDTIPAPNPIGDSVTGVLSTENGVTRRYWVQRAGPGSGTHSLAYFDDGDAGMTEVPLTFVGGGASLLSILSAITLGPRGDFVYVAFLEDPTGIVRLFKVDVATGTETAALTLSPTAHANTAPRGMVLSSSREELVVACREGAGGARLVFVDLETFTEIDRDPNVVGTQGLPLPQIPAQVARLVDRYGTPSVDGGSTVNAQQVRFSDDAIFERTTTTTGSSTQMVSSFAGVLALQPVQGYSDGEGVVVRNAFDGYFGASTLVISDDVGGVATNRTSVVAAAREPSADRFLLLLDGGILTRWIWNTVQLFQEDLDPNTDGVQAVDGGADWTDVVTIGTDTGLFPSP